MNSSHRLFSASDLDGGAANAESFRASFPTLLTLRSSASTFADANQSPYADDLLTPPLTNPSLDEPPFRPAESDRTSLSMKVRHGSSHQGRRGHNRACLSSGDVDQTALFHSESSRHIRSLSRSKSAPNLTKLVRKAFSRSDACETGTLRIATDFTREAELASHRDRLPKHPRRWTMPGKAAPTHVLISMSPSAILAEQNELHNDEGEPTDRAVSVETPAMITLQRAASGRLRRTSLRPEAYTSFPTPTFSKTRSGFVTTFFGDGWQRPDSTCICARIESVFIASHSRYRLPCSDRASVDRGNVRPSHSTTADPVCTDVVLDPVVQGEMSDTQPVFRARRCSTKYVSGISTYEIIWDENVSTSSSSASRRTSTEPTRRISTRDNDIVSTRRQSVAIDKLETQLFKEIEQSRKTSSASRMRGAARSEPPTRRTTNRQFFNNMMNFQRVGCDGEEKSDSPPRSRISTTSKQKLTGPRMDFHLKTTIGDETLTRQVGFFPPLPPNPTGLDTANDPLLANPWLSSWETGSVAVSATPISAEKIDG